jgi:hypothetical protein
MMFHLWRHPIRSLKHLIHFLVLSFLTYQVINPLNLMITQTTMLIATKLVMFIIMEL